MPDIIAKLGARTAVGDAPLARRSLEAVRQHLGMDVAYVSEFVGEQAVFREVDAPGLEHLLSRGDTRPLSSVYCLHILEGRLPELIPDTSKVPFAAELALTRQVPIGAHVSVPIRHANGDVYGMFCCLSATPRATLNERDLHIVRAFAGLVAQEIERDTGERQRLDQANARIRQVLDEGGLVFHLQPICTLACGTPIGFEALARFNAEPRRSPDQWFLEATQAGLGIELEIAAIAAALPIRERLDRNLTLAFNVSPATILSGKLHELLDGISLDRLVLELTEHAAVDNYRELCERLQPLRRRGLGLAIDDAGAGFAGLHHILELCPDTIKLDMTLIRDIDTDVARQALAEAMLTFGRKTEATLIAEGIETERELERLVMLGFTRGQGYLLGRPKPVDDVLGVRRKAAVAE